MKFLIAILWLSLSFAVAGPVSYYGKLEASGNKIIGSKTGDTPVQVRGVSFGWSNTSWESGRFYQAANAATAVEHMVKDWKAEVVRAAYGATSSAFTSTDAATNRAGVERIVDGAIANDVYVIIDWHSHKAHNEIQQSKDFFDYMAQKYGSYDNVIFEIYNEPVCRDGTTNCAAADRINWAEIKSYAEQIIPVIRAYSSNLILVGTPQWSQRVQDVAGNKLDGNVGYVLHFYAHTHPLNSFRNNINAALNGNVPLFVTEYGTVHADGGQNSNYDTHNVQNSDDWHSFMDQNKISSAAWQINDKYEGSCFFGIQGAAKKFDMESWADKTKMTPSGQYIFDKLNAYYQNAPWKDGPSPIKPLAVNLQDMGDVSVEIFSLQGKKLGTGRSVSDLNLKSGTYILLVRQGSQTKVLKIVKK
ncbi:MAG: cellulase family glycosylhydrolase [Fibromonadaceae bacterium]|jgi:endoglucanase|nr:cellulase family glycosylhydrolase [Fibromonadaceae bacterium]